MSIYQISHQIVQTALPDLGLALDNTNFGTDDEKEFQILLNRCNTLKVPISSFTDLSLGIIFNFSRVFSADLLLTIGAYHGIGASALAAGRISSANQEPVLSILCEIDEECSASLINLSRWLDIKTRKKWKIENSNVKFTTKCTPTPSPEVVLEIPSFSKMISLIDLDHPKHGKRGYADAVRSISQNTKGEKLLIFHDVSVPKFSADMELLKSELFSIGASFVEVPCDDCGLGIAYVNR